MISIFFLLFFWYRSCFAFFFFVKLVRTSVNYISIVFMKGSVHVSRGFPPLCLPLVQVSIKFRIWQKQNQTKNRQVNKPDGEYYNIWFVHRRQAATLLLSLFVDKSFGWWEAGSCQKLDKKISPAPLRNAPKASIFISDCSCSLHFLFFRFLMKR